MSLTVMKSSINAHVERSRNLVLTDPFDLVRHAFDLSFALRSPHLGENGTHRIAGDDLNLWILLLQIAPHARDRAAGSRRVDEVCDAPFGLLPDLGPGRLVVGLRVRVVVELVGENRVRRLMRDPLRHHHVVVGMVGRHRRRRHDHLGAERLEQSHFFLRHLVRHREDALVALERRGDRQPDAGVAARPLDDRPAGLESPFALRLLDDRTTNAILDRTAGIEDLRLRVDRRAHATRHSVKADERRPSDRSEHVVVRLGVPLRHRGMRDV